MIRVCNSCGAFNIDDGHACAGGANSLAFACPTITQTRESGAQLKDDDNYLTTDEMLKHAGRTNASMADSIVKLEAERAQLKGLIKHLKYDNERIKLFNDEILNERDQLKAEVTRLNEKYDLQLLVKKCDRYHKALELVRAKTVTDPAHEVELRARAAFVYRTVCEALRGDGET